MASLTLSTMMPNAALRSLAAFTSWTILRSVPSMLRGFLPDFSVPHRQTRRKFFECATIDLALEGDHLPQRIPVTDPAPAIELGLAGQIHAYTVLGAGQAQQEPLLFLADAQRLAVGSHQALRQTITQPATGAGEDLHILLFQAHFFVEFAKQRLFRRFTGVDTALGDLPGILIDPPSPQHLTDIIGQDDADIGAKTIGIDHGIPPRRRMPGHCPKKPQKAESAASRRSARAPDPRCTAWQMGRDCTADDLTAMLGAALTIPEEIFRAPGSIRSRQHTAGR